MVIVNARNIQNVIKGPPEIDKMFLFISQYNYIPCLESLLWEVSSAICEPWWFSWLNHRVDEWLQRIQKDELQKLTKLSSLYRSTQLYYVLRDGWKFCSFPDMSQSSVRALRHHDTYSDNGRRQAVIELAPSIKEAALLRYSQKKWNSQKRTSKNHGQSLIAQRKNSRQKQWEWLDSKTESNHSYAEILHETAF